MRLPAPTFETPSALRVRLLLGDPLRQESGTLNIIVRGTPYTVNYDQQCVIAEPSGEEGGAGASVGERRSFFVNTRELWEEADRGWAEDGLIIAGLLLPPPADATPSPERGATGGMTTAPGSSPWGVRHDSQAAWEAVWEAQSQAWEAQSQAQELILHQGEESIHLPTELLTDLHLSDQASTNPEDEQEATGGSVTAPKPSPWGVRRDNPEDWHAVWEAQSQELLLRQEEERVMTSSTASSSLDSEESVDRPARIAEQMFMRQLWAKPACDFKTALESYSFDALVRLGGVCESERIYSLSHKKYFCQKVLQLAEGVRTAGLRQIAALCKPFESSECHSTTLMQQLGDRISAILAEGDLTATDLTYLGRIYKRMMQVSFYHFCLQETAEYFSRFRLNNIGFTVPGLLNLFRNTVMLDALITQNKQENSTVRQALLGMYGQLDDLLQQTQLKQHHEEMVRWIKLYGRHVLKLHTSIKRLARPPEPNPSAFQKNLEQQLRKHLGQWKTLPDVTLEAEKLLPDLQFAVDLYCEPKIVIEADGVNIHTSIDLDHISTDTLESSGMSQGPGLWYRQYEDQTSRILSNTVLKTCIMESAGYTVYRVSDYRSPTVARLAASIQQKRALQQHLGRYQK